MQSKNFSELWKTIDWRKVRKTVFRLQIRLFKAMRAKDNARVRNLQNLILRSRSARILAIRQVTQLNAGVRFVPSLIHKLGDFILGIRIA